MLLVVPFEGTGVVISLANQHHSSMPTVRNLAKLQIRLYFVTPRHSDDTRRKHAGQPQSEIHFRFAT